MLVSGASAVTYDLATVSIVVRQANAMTGAITTTVLNNRSFLNFVSTTANIPKSDLFIAISESTGELLVIQRSTETIRFGIVTSVGGVGGSASNNANTVRYSAFSCQLSSLTATVNGFLNETVKRNRAGAITSISRSFFGGGGQVIKGTAVTTGRKITL